MPAAKKSPTVHRRAKSSHTSTKAHASSPKPTDTQHENVSRATHSSKPTPPPASPTATTDKLYPLPMPVTPERMPSRLYTPLIRTTYNSDWLRRVGMVVGVLSVIGLSYAGWTFRSYLPSFTAATKNDKSDEVTQLSISPTPTPNLTKLNQLSSKLSPQASTSAQQDPLNIDQASSSAQLAQSLNSHSIISLKSELNRYIVEFDQKQVNTNNLKAYQAKAADLEDRGENDQARQWLAEAVLHAYEIAVLNGYYDN